MKDLSKELVVRELITTLSLFRKNPFWLVIASVIDALFFLAWGFFTTPVSDKILAHSVLLANQLSDMMRQQGRVPTGLLVKLFGPELWPYTAKLLTLIFVLFVVSYLIYTIFHGSSWMIATQIAGEKRTYGKYMLGFAKINLLWMLCYIIYKFFDVIAGLRHVLINKIAPGAPNIAGNVLLGILAVVFVSAIFSYPQLKAKTLFKTPLRVSIPLIVLSTSIYLCAQFILNMISKANLNTALLFGLIILFPTMNLIRVYITRVLSHVHAHT